MGSDYENADMAIALIAEYGTAAKSEARRQLIMASARGDLDEVQRWNLIESLIGAREELMWGGPSCLVREW